MDNQNAQHDPPRSPGAPSIHVRHVDPSWASTHASVDPWIANARRARKIEAKRTQKTALTTKKARIHLENKPNSKPSTSRSA